MNPIQFLKGLVPRNSLLRTVYRAGRAAYTEDGMIVDRNVSWMNEPKFNEAYSESWGSGPLKAMGNPHIRWRAHVACWAAQQAIALDGDFVECGVNEGFLSKMIIQYTNFESYKKTFWLLDTYEGFDPRYLSAAEQATQKKAHKALGKSGPWYRGMYEPVWEIVQQKFGRYPFVKLVKGAVPDTLPEVTAPKVAFLSLDMNCAAPEVEALEYFWDKLTPGGIVLFDDYGFVGHEEQHERENEFARAKGVAICALPTGQGLLIKPINPPPH